MVLRRTLPAPSMKLTPQRFTWNFSCGEALRSSRQHCSRVATFCPTRRPSTLRIVLDFRLSVVILSILLGPPIPAALRAPKWLKIPQHVSICFSVVYMGSRDIGAPCIALIWAYTHIWAY